MIRQRYYSTLTALWQGRFKKSLAPQKDGPWARDMSLLLFNFILSFGVLANPFVALKLEKNIDENELLRRASRGDQSAFSTLFKSYHPFVYAFSRRITRSDELAEEVVQDIFLKIWVDRESLENIDNFGGYLNRIVRNHCYNVLRKLAMESKHASLLSTDFDDTDDSTVQQLDYSDVNEVLEGAIQTLSTQQKNVYQLCHQRGLTYQEAADELGISQQTVHAYMKDALRKIRDHFRKHGISYSLFFAVLFK